MSTSSGQPASHLIQRAHTQDYRVRELEARLSAQEDSLICALNQLLDLKDLNTGCHSTRLAEWSLRVAQQLGVQERDMRDVEVAALLHDIGKMGIPDSILKKPGRLTEDEYALMKKHPEYGWGVIRIFQSMQNASLFILHHHEAFDGKGYPAGLKNSEIPLGARIVSVIDAFDAMISNRPYRTGMPFDEAMRRLFVSAGSQFDPAVVSCFARIAHTDVESVYELTGTGVGVSV
jgi:putative nucleotidyltransferase with HDIG domain